MRSNLRRVAVCWCVVGIAAVSAIQGCSEPPASDLPLAAGWELDPRPLVELGELDGSPPETFSRLADVGLLGDGGVVVADGASGTLRIFGPDGTFEREMGREGQGPGEFAFLGSLHVLAGDTLLVYDPVAYRLTTFSRSGELLGTLQMETGGGAPEAYLGRSTSGAHLVALIRPEPRDASRVTADVIEVRRYAPDGGSWVSLGVFPGMRRARSPVPLSPHFVGAVLGDTVFVTDGLLPSLTRFSTFDSSSVAVEAGPVELLPGEAWERLAGAVDDDALRERLGATRDGPTWDSIPRFSDLLPSRGGTLWLKEYDSARDSHWVLRQRTGGRWTVVSPGGRRIASVAMPDDFRLTAVGADRVAGISKDSLGLEHVRVYRVERPAP